MCGEEDGGAGEEGEVGTEEEENDFRNVGADNGQWSNDESSNNNVELNEYENENDCEESINNKSTNPITTFNFLLTNARSLAPKIDSFVENFHERDTDLCVVTETWLNEGSGLLQDGSVDLGLGEGIGAAHCGRRIGERGGGVGIFYRTSKMKIVDITPTDNPHEIVAVLCSLRGTAKKILCIGAYLTTALTQPQSEVFLQYINDLLHLFKSKYQDPHIIVAGDWNRGDTSIFHEDFSNLNVIDTPPYSW